MNNVLVDTDVLINFLRGKQAVKDFLASLVGDAAIHCSVITVTEIYSGMKNHEKEKTNELIDSLHILDVTLEIAEKAAQYKREEKRQFLELADCLIAATAYVKNCFLATGNLKHYPMPDVQKTVVRT